MDLSKFAINYELKGGFLLFTSEILGYHKQKWPMNIKTFLINLFVKEAYCAVNILHKSYVSNRSNVSVRKE